MRERVLYVVLSKERFVPVVICSNYGKIRDLLDQYVKSEYEDFESVKFIPYETKVPDKYEGKYVYKIKDKDDIEFTIYCMLLDDID